MQKELCVLVHVESTEPKQLYGVKLDFVSERTIKDHHHHALAGGVVRSRRAIICLVDFLKRRKLERLSAW